MRFTVLERQRSSKNSGRLRSFGEAAVQKKLRTTTQFSGILTVMPLPDHALVKRWPMSPDIIFIEFRAVGFGKPQDKIATLFLLGELVRL